MGYIFLSNLEVNTRNKLTKNINNIRCVCNNMKNIDENTFSVCFDNAISKINEFDMSKTIAKDYSYIALSYLNFNEIIPNTYPYYYSLFKERSNDYSEKLKQENITDLKKCEYCTEYILNEILLLYMNEIYSSSVLLDKVMENKDMSYSRFKNFVDDIFEGIYKIEPSIRNDYNRIIHHINTTCGNIYYSDAVKIAKKKLISGLPIDKNRPFFVQFLEIDIENFENLSDYYYNAGELVNEYPSKYSSIRQTLNFNLSLFEKFLENKYDKHIITNVLADCLVYTVIYVYLKNKFNLNTLYSLKHNFI